MLHVGPGGLDQCVGCLSSVHKALDLVPGLHVLGMVVDVCTGG